MRSLRSAAELLASVDSVERAAALLRDLHFDQSPLLLNPEESARFGIVDVVTHPHIVEGKGAIRALVAESVDSTPLRETVSRLARTLSSRTPHVLWLLVIVSATTREFVIAAWQLHGSSPRVAALIASIDSIVDSDAETFLSLADITSSSDLLTHSRYTDVLGRQSMTRRFYTSLTKCVSGIADSVEPAVQPDDAAELALLNVSRLLFLSFLETKGWLNGDHAFLANRYADCIIAGGRFHERVLLPLFFGTLNTSTTNRARRAREFGRIPFLNGGLFTRAGVERRHRVARCSDEAVGDLFAELLTRYRFTAREDTTTWSEAAIDPEMLGKAFESLMASAERKSSGAFYTPQSLVEQLTASALASALASSEISVETVARALAGEIPAPTIRESLLKATECIRIIDPACGSGAFLVHSLELLAGLRVRLGDLRPLHRLRRAILANSIFGVDSNRTAVWLCELRLWLSVAIEDPERDPLRVVALPNIDRNIRVGNSLDGGTFVDGGYAGSRSLSLLRDRYSRAVGRRKATLARTLDSAERRAAIDQLGRRLETLTRERRELISATRSRDLFGERRYVANADRMSLAELRREMSDVRRALRSAKEGAGLPFHFASHFADAAAAGGFDCVLGNPPWVRIHNIGDSDRRKYGEKFDVAHRGGWRDGADAAAAGSGFGSQIDLAALFVEQSIALARRRGIIALIVPAKLWRSLAGGGLREFLFERTRIIEIHDLTDARDLFDAAVYPSVIVAERRDKSRRSEVSEVGAETSGSQAIAVVHRADSAIHWRFNSCELAFDQSPGSPWLLLPPEVRAAFDLVRSKGIPLGRTSIGRPWLGVKTGCNAAFVVDEISAAGECMEVRSGSRTGVIERRLLRPLYRGDSIQPWRMHATTNRIIWTHDRRGEPLQELPKHTRSWLSAYRRELERRTDNRNGGPWWRLFRTESASTACTRVVWPDFGRSPAAAIVEAGCDAVFLNSCYVAMCRDADSAIALMVLLNSPIVAAWLNPIAEPARGGYRRYLGWTMSLVPLPADWERAKRNLVPLGRAAMAGCVPSDDSIRDATLKSYGLRDADVESLVLWNGR
ncbi:MAG TPA: N-6 DNA methylase [Gemmatimonadaceae bacterium]